MIYADTAFRMGAAHQVCEDYAAKGGHDGSIVAVVSDGCSSATDTDIGARALARAAVRLFSHAPGIDNDDAVKILAADAIRSAAAMDAGRQSCYATLLAIIHSGGQFRVLRWGDGIFGYRDYLGTTTVHVITWPEEKPYYPVYSLRGEVEAWPTETIITLRGAEIDVQEPKEVLSLSCEKVLDSELVDLVFVGSDGWSSFYDKTNRDPIPVQDVLQKLLPFRSSGPSFVQRRIGAFQRSLKQNNWEHGDDLSLAAIHRRDAP